MRFILIFALSASFLLGSVAAINYLVDPFLLFERARIPGFNFHKPDYARRERTAKARALQVRQPRTVIFGTSRAQRGFDPSSQAWPETARPIFNAGLPGSGLEANIQLFEKVAEAGALELALIEAEFESFLAAPATPMTTAALYPAKDSFDALFSLQALTSSLRTVALQNAPGISDIGDDGFNALPQAEFELNQVGHYQLFRDKIRRLYDDMLEEKCNGLAAPGTRENYTRTIKKALYASLKNDVRLVFVIPPYHADLLLTIWSLGLWDDFENWKRQLSSEISAFAELNPESRIELWDFTGFGSVQAEPVPMSGDRNARMIWHLEPSHFSVRLGELVLERIFGSEEKTFPDGFGARLTPGMLQRHLLTQRQELWSYRDRAAGRYDDVLGGPTQHNTTSEMSCLGRAK